MTRALTPFKVVDAKKGDLSSGDPLERSDRVTLRQLPLQRKEPLVCQELNLDELSKYLVYIEDMESVELFSKNFTVQWKQKRDITVEEYRALVDRDPRLDAMQDILCGKQGISIMQSQNKVGDQVCYGYSLLAYNRGVNGQYDTLVCHAQQEVHREESHFERRLASEAVQMASQVRDEESSGMLSRFWRTVLSEKKFDRMYGVEEKSKRRASDSVEKLERHEREIAFQQVLAGYIMKMAMTEDKLQFENCSGRDSVLKLLP